MLTLLIVEKKITISEVSGNFFSVFPIVSLDPLHDNTDIHALKFPEEIEAVEFVRLGEEGGELVRYELPEDVSAAIIFFLSHYHARKNIGFDCYSFANLVKSVPMHSCNYLLDYWKFRDGVERAVPGDIVFLLNPSEGVFLHAAVYIGEKKFISVYGAGGDLEVSSLKDMRDEYQADAIVFVEPRR